MPSQTDCSNRVDFDQDDEGPPCGDEGELCSVCTGKEAAYWAAYFGLRTGMTSEQRRNVIERWNPNPEIEPGVRQ